MANEYADTMGCPEPPMVDKKVVGKMGLKGVPGLRVGTIERDEPSRQGPRQGLRQGPRPEKPSGNGGKGRGNTDGRNGSNGAATSNNERTRTGGVPLSNWGNGGNDNSNTKNGGRRGKRRGGAGGVDDRAAKR